MIGTRPQLIKLKPIVSAFESANLEHAYIDTGQHYDFALAQNQIANLGLPEPLRNLQVRETRQAVQISSIMSKLDNLLNDFKPEWMLVYGDTNSALASSMVAIKNGIPVAHIESGLRSGNFKMSEEQNRIVVDHVSQLLFAPTLKSTENLKLEGLAEKSFFVGDVMLDLIESYRDFFDSRSEPNSDYILCTLHRAENVDDFERLNQIMFNLSKISIPIKLLIHPRLEKRMREFQLPFPANVEVCNPPPHKIACLMLAESRGLITDSGGLQKEAFFLGIPTTTLRNETEWPETLKDGHNVLLENLVDLKDCVVRDKFQPDTSEFGRGNAARQIASIIGSN